MKPFYLISVKQVRKYKNIFSLNNVMKFYQFSITSDSKNKTNNDRLEY